MRSKRPIHGIPGNSLWGSRMGIWDDLRVGSEWPKLICWATGKIIFGWQHRRLQSQTASDWNRNDCFARRFAPVHNQEGITMTLWPTLPCKTCPGLAIHTWGPIGFHSSPCMCVPMDGFAKLTMSNRVFIHPKYRYPSIASVYHKTFHLYQEVVSNYCR